MISTESARGQRWRELSELLPNIGRACHRECSKPEPCSSRVQQAVPLLSAPGSNLSSVPRVTPAFNYFDARLSLSQSIFNFKYLEQERASLQNLKAAQLTYKDAREMVVLSVGNAYLQAIAAAARVETTEAQVKSAQALYDKACRPTESRFDSRDRRVAIAS